MSEMRASFQKLTHAEFWQRHGTSPVMCLGELLAQRMLATGAILETGARSFACGMERLIGEDAALRKNQI
ncbi:MAG: hypothetical protein KDJ29_20860 [Hyphomicrobiales bacterium]|nr:hypothetical protein [Hyphomicrobiales bacterium]